MRSRFCKGEIEFAYDLEDIPDDAPGVWRVIEGGHRVFTPRERFLWECKTHQRGGMIEIVGDKVIRVRCPPMCRVTLAQAQTAWDSLVRAKQVHVRQATTEVAVAVARFDETFATGSIESQEVRMENHQEIVQLSQEEAKRLEEMQKELMANADKDMALASLIDILKSGQVTKGELEKIRQTIDDAIMPKAGFKKFWHKYGDLVMGVLGGATAVIVTEKAIEYFSDPTF